MEPLVFEYFPLFSIIAEFADGVETVVKIGTIAMIQLYAQNYPKEHEKIIEFSCKYNHLDVLQCVNIQQKHFKNAMDIAVEYGHLEVVKWLHENCAEGCTTDAMDFAAKSGHLEVVKWLHENRTEG